MKIRWLHFILFCFHGCNITPYTVNTVVTFLDSVLTRVHWSDCLMCFLRERNTKLRWLLCGAEQRRLFTSWRQLSHLHQKGRPACNATDQIFILDQDGVIYHKRSKKNVCPQGNSFLVLLCTLVLLFLELFMNGIWILIDYFRSQLSSFLLLYLFFTSYDHRPNFWVMLLHFSSNSNIPEVLLPFQAWPIKILLSRG